MAGRRLNVLDVREMVRWFRLGQSDRRVAHDMAFNEWPELFDNPVLASAALDRLAHGATQIVITGDSYRAEGPAVRAAVAAHG